MSAAEPILSLLPAPLPNPEGAVELTRAFDAGSYPPSQLLLDLSRAALYVSSQVELLRAAAQLINDGRAYAVPAGGAPLFDLRGCAALHHALKTLADAGGDLEKSAKRALNGDDAKQGADGHAARFAEVLLSLGLTSAKIPGYGTATVSAKPTAYPPPKAPDEPLVAQLRAAAEQKSSWDYLLTLDSASLARWASAQGLAAPPSLLFRAWCRERGLLSETWSWAALQKLAREAQEGGEPLPPFVSVRDRSSVRFTLE